MFIFLKLLNIYKLFQSTLINKINIVIYSNIIRIIRGTIHFSSFSVQKSIFSKVVPLE